MDALVGRVARAGGGRGFILNWGIPFRLEDNLEHSKGLPRQARGPRPHTLALEPPPDGTWVSCWFGL